LLPGSVSLNGSLVGFFKVIPDFKARRPFLLFFVLAMEKKSDIGMKASPFHPNQHVKGLSLEIDHSKTRFTSLALSNPYNWEFEHYEQPFFFL